MLNDDNTSLVDGKYAIGDLIDLNELRRIFERFTDATGFTIGFLDHPGMNILIATGWKDLCTKIHRNCPLSAENCVRSNQHLLNSLDVPGKLLIERCENGLVDCAFPIFVKGKHVASLATGQLLTEKPDLDKFRQQARHFGVDEKTYMDALAEIPIVSEEKLRSVTTFLGEMALVFSQLGYAHLVIKENAERLEQEIATRKLAEERQRKSEEQLQQAQKIESIGRLAGGIAHDFNNMLGVILGHTEIALEQVDPALPLHAELNEIQKAARRSADLTRQLLAFSRKQPIVPKVLDLNETVAGMLTMLRRLIGEHINLTWQPGAGLCRVKMDPSQIDQILTNLCVNSRDAITRTGNITVRSDNITLGEAYCADHLDAVPGQYVLLEVIDDGCGMKKNILAHVFEPFFTTKELGKGSGLGLSTVYGIVTQNKGSITANSESGKGTTISIYLPYFEGTPTPTIDDIETEAPTGQGEIVLVVEDEPSMRLTCSRFLETLGYTVLVADTPAAAQDIVARNPGGIHLLLTDILMPGMNGPDLAHSLISLDPNLKCLFMSGYTPTEIIPLIAPGEKVFFIQKPFSRKELAVKVREVLRTRPSDHNAGI